MTVAPGSTAISSRFAGLKQQGRCALMPFLTAGDPDLATTARPYWPCKPMALIWWSWASPTAIPWPMAR